MLNWIELIINSNSIHELIRALVMCFLAMFIDTKCVNWDGGEQVEDTTEFDLPQCLRLQPQIWGRYITLCRL